MTSGLKKRIDQNLKVLIMLLLFSYSMQSKFETSDHVDFCSPIQCLMVEERVERGKAVEHANDSRAN